MTTDNKSVNNAELKAFIKEQTPRCEAASSKDDISAIFDACMAFPYRFQLNLTVYYIAIAVTVLVAIYVATLGAEKNMVLLIISLIPVAIAVGAGYWQYRKVPQFEKCLVDKTMQILYKGSPCSATFLEEKCQQFSDFTRGNHKNNLTEGSDMAFNSCAGSLRVAVVKYRYVDESEHEDSDGTTRKTYSTYYRQGVIFPAVGQIHSLVISENRISSRWKATFKPASRSFQRLFRRVRGESELMIAKFLEPDVVLMLEKAAKELKDLTVEFNESGEMLICQKDTNLLKLKTEHHITSPALLREELFGASYKKLDYLLAFADNLIKQMK